MVMLRKIMGVDIMRLKRKSIQSFEKCFVGCLSVATSVQYYKEVILTVSHFGHSYLCKMSSLKRTDYIFLLFKSIIHTIPLFSKEK